MRHFIIIICLLLFPGVRASGQATVSGTVADAVSGKAIAGVNVMVKDSRGRLSGFSTTDDAGAFTIRLRENGDSLTVTASMMGYRTYTAPLAADGAPVRILMEDGALDLRELVVKGARIRGHGDTITYDVGSFARKQDRTIGDVLRRMPGIDVESSGRIQYQGVDINKLYIEGNDLLGGRYGIATNGISHDDIGAVEVMENHQPMQVLRGLSFSDQAAINLKMKNRSKATVLVHGTLGGGWSRQPEGSLWQGDIFTMLVTGKYQMITTLKGNNTGHDLSGQLTDFTSGRADERPEGYISLTTPPTPGLQRNRSYLNRSWMLSSSHLLKRGAGEFKAQVDYSHDRVTAQGSARTTYFLDSGESVILEDRNSLSHRHAVGGSFSYEMNGKTCFLSNILAADLSWNDLGLVTTGTVPNTQTARMPEYSVSNLLRVIRRFGGNRLVTFTSRNEWHSLPESLTVSRDGKDYGERIRQHSFYTDERASLGFVLRGMLLSLETGMAGYLRNLDTGLWGADIPEASGSGTVTTDYLRLFASPKLEWSRGKLELTLSVPVNIYTYFFSGSLRDRTEFFLSPSLSARWRLTPGMSLTLRGSARRSPASLHNIHATSILTDYRSFSSGVDDYHTTSAQSVSASYSWRNIRHGVFLMAMGSYGWNRSKTGTVQEVAGDYIFHSYRTRPSDTGSATGFLTLSKTLDFMGGTAGLKGTCHMSSGSLLSQGVVTDRRSGTYSLSPTLSGAISSFLNWNLQFTWKRSTLSISGMESCSSDDYVYSGSITVTPCRLVTWTAGGEFYRNGIETGRYKEMLMLDTKLTFNVSKRVEISASVTNLLDRRSYSYTTYGPVSQYERSSLLRGREFLISIYLKK